MEQHIEDGLINSYWFLQYLRTQKNAKEIYFDKDFILNNGVRGIE